MIRIILLSLCAAMVAIAAGQPAPEPVRPPKSAVRISENHYRYTDPKGVVWEYRNTPFGWSKARATKESGVKRPTDSQVKTTVIDLGSSVRFERAGPFGVARWERDKSELTIEEQTMFEEHRKSSAAKGDKE